MVGGLAGERAVADKPSDPEYLEWSPKLARPGSVIVGVVTDAASGDPRVHGVRRFTELIAAHPRLTATTMQTVGSKGYHGFTLALVTE